MDHSISPDILRVRACNLRKDVVRATTAAGSGHPTSAASAADLLSVLFFSSMHLDPNNFKSPLNDRFVLSKGHAAPVLYAVWKQLGAISDEELLTLRTFNSPLEGHPTSRFCRNEAATGSLGQGLSIGAGMACALKADKSPARVFVLLGDSELAEGSNWEAVHIAVHYKLDNLIAIVDVNRLGQRGETIEGHDLAAYERIFAAFGWKTSTVDGHDIPAIQKAFDALLEAPAGAPSVLLAQTIKGYGLGPDVEDKNGFHGKAFSPEQAKQLLERLNCPELATLPPCVRMAHLCSSGQNEPYPVFARFEGKALQASYERETLVATRRAYGEALAQIGALDNRIIALDAEVKNSTYSEIFEKAFPERFYECFIAEQNMIGMGVGFASRGKIPFCSTFASFLTRAHDQIRMAAIGKVPVRCVGSHAGVSIGQDGPSQMGLEDIALFRALPESIVLYPCDAVSTAACVDLMARYNAGVSYLRLTRSETPVYYAADREFTLGGYHVLRSFPFDRCCIVTAGITVFEALKAADLLQDQGIEVRVIDCYSIKPLPVDALAREIQDCNGCLVTVEDHYRAGGLGEALVSALPALDFKTHILAVTQLPRSGIPQELMAYAEIDAHAIVKAVAGLVMQNPLSNFAPNARSS